LLPFTLIIAWLADLLFVPALVKLGAINFSPHPGRQTFDGQVDFGRGCPANSPAVRITKSISNTLK
jgi:hypothetical protein